ncbi:MAG: DUF547 domain-containing protein [Gemmatimonadota bacterium]|nr:DUF547 domain-containing protein [Gemmatimonadota bacterium]
MRHVLVLLALLLLPVPLLAQRAEPPSYGISRAWDDYASVLDRYVDDGRVDYGRWKAERPSAWARLLAWLEAADPAAWPIDRRRAFWINAYNIRVIAGVLERYPIESVREVGLLGGRIRGFFSREEHPVAGEERTLDEIEKEILLEPPLFDPRIHWALVCASKGCPELRPEPYRAGKLDMQLDFQARTYLNGPAGHRLDRGRRTLHLTRIFDWYDDDFEDAAGSVREYAARYLTGAAAKAARDPDWEIEYLEYDWSLNDRR